MTDEQTSYSMIDPTGCDVPRTLDELPMGASAVITSVDCDSNQLRQHIFDMGLTPGVRVTVQKEAPLGDPIQLCLRGYELTIRKADAAQISIGDVDENPGDREEPVAKMNTSDPVLASETLHPSFGEEDVNGALRDGAVEHIVAQMESETGVDRMAAISDMRFTFIERTCAKCVWRPRMSREHEHSLKADRILTGKCTAIPMFILIMAVVFWLTFNVVGQPLSDLLGEGIEWLTQAVRDGLDSLEVNPLVISLVCDGVFPGVGTVLSFLPIIVVLFLLLSALEDTGYMARVAFFMDKLLRKLGLSGRSFVPLIMGFGCSVPAIMATRTLPSEHDRRMTIMLVPFMSCSAKLPVYALLCGFFFAQYAALAMLSLYLLGIVVGILAAVVLSRTVFRGDPVPFVMELPNYRLPSVGTVCRLAWDKAKEFAKKAFTVVFVATIIIWFLQTFDVRFNVVADQTQSMLAGIGTVFAPIFAPLGFGDWRAATAVLTGFMAKENVISTITQLVGGNLALLTTIFTPLAAYSFLVFVLLYTPCVMSIITVKGELGGKYAAAIVVVQCVIAWLVAFVVHGIGLLLGL